MISSSRVEKFLLLVLLVAVPAGAAQTAQAQTQRQRSEPSPVPQQPSPVAAERPAAGTQPPAPSNQNAVRGGGQPRAAARRLRTAERAAPVNTPPTAPEAPPQAVAPPPAKPEQMPPTVPQVSLQNGLLTIVAQNATLVDILTAVRRLTESALEAPPEAGTERVAVRLGPAAPREVLANLLNGSRFDYIILSPPQTPGGVQRIILTARQGSSEPGTTAAGAAATPPPPTSTLPRPVNPAMAADTDDDESEGIAPAPTMAPPVQPAQAPAANQPNPNQPPQVKTPQELLEELQHLQQQGTPLRPPRPRRQQ